MRFGGWVFGGVGGDVGVDPQNGAVAEGPRCARHMRALDLVTVGSDRLLRVDGAGVTDDGGRCK